MHDGANTHISLTVAAADVDQRLDRFLAGRLPALSRSRLQALIRSGEVTRSGSRVAALSSKVKLGEVYEVHLPEPEPARPRAQALELVIVYEDSHLLVIDKPSGLAVHPGPGHASGTLVNALLAYCGDSLSGIGGVRRPGIVHRLDKDTTGLLVVAKTDPVHRGLAQQFASHGADGRLGRGYRAIVWGRLERPSGVIDLALSRSRTNRTKIDVVPADAGRRAVTHFKTERVFTSPEGDVRASLLHLRLETGRTHQVRVHLAHVGHPLLGDMTYGAGFKASARRLGVQAQAALAALGRQALHACELSFEHPVSGKRLQFESALPADMAALAAALEAEAGSASYTPQPAIKSKQRKTPAS